MVLNAQWEMFSFEGFESKREGIQRGKKVALGVRSPCDYVFVGVEWVYAQDRSPGLPADGSSRGRGLESERH